MQIYSITVIKENGKKSKKIIELDDNEDVITYLDSLDINVISIKKLPSYARFIKPKVKVKSKEVIEIIENIHMVVKAGLPVNTALNDLAKDADNPNLKNILEDIAHRIQTGLTLSKAMEKHRNIFSSMTINLVRIGEETGQLEQTLSDSAANLTRISDLTDKTKSAMIYPSFALFGMVATMIFWLVVVMPKMITAFKSFQIELPPTTLFIIGISEFMQTYLLQIIAGVLIGFVAHKTLRKSNPGYRYLTDKLLIKLPIFGTVVRNFNFAFIAEYIRLMISAGLPLYMALTIMEESLTNSVYKKSIEDSRELISVGKSFSAALAEQNMYPNVIIRMINIGEQTGNLDTQLENITSHYYYKVDYTATNISKMIEPLVIGFVGIFMLIIMLGFMGPVFSLITNMPT